jgi:thiol-disulfide isomerase/thioredoxin
MKAFLIILVLVFPTFAQSEAEKQGREIFAKYQSAIGGKENLVKIKTIEIIEESESSIGKTRSISIEDKPNNKSYLSIENDTRKIEIGSNGKSGWTRQNRRVFNVTFPSPEEVKKYVKLPNETIDGKEYLVVEEIKSDSRANAKTYYSPETFLLIRRENMAGVGGNTFKMITVYSDYRKVGEILIPFLEVSSGGMVGKTTKKILRIRYNIEIDPKIFDKNGISPEIPQDIFTVKQPIILTAPKNTVFKDENGKIITQAEFYEKRFGANYLAEVETSNEKIVGLKLKKGNPETAIGAIPSDFQSAALDNSTIQLSQFKGKIVVLNFWFLACSPCIKEIPELNDLVTKYEGKEVEFIAVTYDSKELVSDYLKKRQFKYKQIVDAQNIVDLYKASAYPTHIVIGKDGKILFTQLGYNSKIIEQMSKIIDSALN